MSIGSIAVAARIVCGLLNPSTHTQPQGRTGGIAPEGGSRIPALDGLRAIACLMVLVGHFITTNGQPIPILPGLFSQYWSGVDLFFVLSGFVIFLSLHRLSQRAGSRHDLLRAYFSARFFRIVPVYGLLVISYILLPVLFRPLAQNGLFLSSIPHWCYPFFMQSLWGVVHQRRGSDYMNVTWSLCAEVFFYIIAFLIVAWVPARRRIRALAVLVLVCYLSRIFFVFVRNDLAAAYILPICRMDGFMIGGICAILYAEGRLPPRNLARLNVVLLSLAPVYGLLAYLGHLQSEPFSIMFSYAFYSLFYSLVVIRVLVGRFGVLARGPLAYFGVISYFVYLFQIPALSAAEAVFSGTTARFISALAILLVAASASWFFLEKPLIRLGRSLAAAARPSRGQGA